MFVACRSSILPPGSRRRSRAADNWRMQARAASNDEHVLLEACVVDSARGRQQMVASSKCNTLCGQSALEGQLFHSKHVR